jgi:hypothetical protein
LWWWRAGWLLDGDVGRLEVWVVLQLGACAK